jgi:hypothetical protein
MNIKVAILVDKAPNISANLPGESSAGYPEGGVRRCSAISRMS